MSVLERAKAHFESLRDQFIDLPEWGQDGVPLRVYFDRPSIRQIRDLVSKARDPNDATEKAARLVIMFAKDGPRPTGKPLFKMGDMLELQSEADPNILAKLAEAIIGQVPNVDELAGNSEGTRSATS